MQECGDADDQLERDERDDDEFEKFVAAASSLIAEKAIDIADAGEFGVDLTLPIRRPKRLATER